MGGTFYYLWSALDGASRAILACDIRSRMREANAELVIRRAREAYPVARPRIISCSDVQLEHLISRFDQIVISLRRPAENLACIGHKF